MQQKNNKTKLDDLLNRKLLYETSKETAPIIQKYLKWLALSVKEKLALIKEWAEYYEKARQTPEALNYFEQREALKNRNMDKVKELAKKATQIREQGLTLPLPSTDDPEAFDHNETIHGYKSTLFQIEQLKKGNIVEQF